MSLTVGSGTKWYIGTHVFHHITFVDEVVYRGRDCVHVFVFGNISTRVGLFRELLIKWLYSSLDSCLNRYLLRILSIFARIAVIVQLLSFSVLYLTSYHGEREDRISIYTWPPT